MQYYKQPISIADQIAQLKSRGLIIEDENVASKVLSVISYFRFANYLRPSEADKTTHIFKPGKQFSNALSLYYFDKLLALLGEQHTARQFPKNRHYRIAEKVSKC